MITAITIACIMSGLALGIVVWAVFLRKTPSSPLEMDVKYLRDNAAIVIQGDGELSDAIIMHKGKVIYTKLKNKEQ